MLDPITGDFKASSFRSILNKFTRRAKQIPIIGDPGNKRSDNYSSTVYILKLAKS